MPAKKQKLTKEKLPTPVTTIDVTSTVVESSAIAHQSSATTISKIDKPRRRGRHPSFKRPLTSPDIFPDGSVNRMASNRVIWEGCNVLTQGESLGWVTTEEGSPYYESPVAKGKGFITFWVTNELYSKHPAALEGEAALALIEEFDIRAACIHLIYAAHATQLERPWEQSFVLSDKQLERYLGLEQNRNFKNKQEKLQMMLDLAKQPCHLLVYVSWPDQGKVKALTISRTSLWEIAEPMLHYQECFEDDDGPLGEKQLVGFTLRIRCGYWAQYFLNQERLADKTGYYEYGILSQGLLHDIMSTWHHHEGAARLMTWLLFKTRVNRTSPLIVETLMKVAFGEKLLEEAKAGFRQRAKLVRLWLTSVKVLMERGWGLTPDPDTYPLQYWVETSPAQPLAKIPDDPEQAAEFWAQDASKPKGEQLTDTTRRSRETFEQLLTSRLWIQPPAAIAEKLDEIDSYRANQRDALPNKASSKAALSLKPTTQQGTSITSQNLREQPDLEEITGEWIRQMRLARHYSQRDLAGHTGISQKMISLIENGERTISRANREKLVRVLQNF